MTKPHEHKDLILKWADGAEIEAYDEFSGKWVPATTPVWQAGVKYRVKPAAPLVETKMTEKERFDAAVGDPISCVAISIYTTLGGDYTPTFTKNLADAAIARALADEQVITLADHWSSLKARFDELYAQQAEQRGARDMAVAKAVLVRFGAPNFVCTESTLRMAIDMVKP